MNLHGSGHSPFRESLNSALEAAVRIDTMVVAVILQRPRRVKAAFAPRGAAQLVESLSHIWGRPHVHVVNVHRGVIHHRPVNPDWGDHLFHDICALFVRAENLPEAPNVIPPDLQPVVSTGCDDGANSVNLCSR